VFAVSSRSRRAEPCVADRGADGGICCTLPEPAWRSDLPGPHPRGRRGSVSHRLFGTGRRISPANAWPFVAVDPAPRGGEKIGRSARAACVSAARTRRIREVRVTPERRRARERGKGRAAGAVRRSPRDPWDFRNSGVRRRCVRSATKCSRCNAVLHPRRVRALAPKARERTFIAASGRSGGSFPGTRRVPESERCRVSGPPFISPKSSRDPATLMA
jgi:hypothetical protein